MPKVDSESVCLTDSNGPPPQFRIEGEFFKPFIKGILDSLLAAEANDVFSTEIGLGEFDPVIVTFQRIGHTAAFAAVRPKSDSSKLQAVMILRSGLDKPEDDAAILQAKQLLGPSIDIRLYDMICKSRPPNFFSVYVNGAAFQDIGVRGALGCVGIAFSHTLATGTDGEETSGQPTQK